MKAIVYEEYGPPDNLQLREIDKPVAGPGEVLVRVRAASANPLDWHFMRGAPYLMRLISGLLRPKSKRLGADLAGVVEAVGDGVTRFSVGDEVYGAVTGAYAEYVCATEDALAPKPANLSFEQAAAVPIAAWTALQFLRDKGGLEPGDEVLVNGASGGVGHFAVQIAKALGANVTGVCSTRNVELVRSLGADRVIDYTREDFTNDGAVYDFVLDTIGNHPLKDVCRVMEPDGKFLMVGAARGGKWAGPMRFMLKTSMSAPFVSQTIISHTAQRSAEDLTYLNQLFESGQITPVIDRQYDLSNVSKAIGYLEEGHARGKVVVTVP